MMPLIARVGVGCRLTLCALGATHGQTIVHGSSFWKTFNFFPQKTPCVVLRSALRRLGLHFARTPAVMIVLALACTLYPMFARADGDYITASIGYYDNNRTIFKIPREYKPEVRDSFFRVIVDYPSMRPTLGPRHPPINSDSLNIVVQGYPKNGTLGEDIVKGALGSKLVGQKNGYKVYSKPLGKSGPSTALVFQDPDGNYVAVEVLGTWAMRDQITHGIQPHYLITFSVSKKSRADFIDVDKSVSKFISGMYVAGDD